MIRNDLLFDVVVFDLFFLFLSIFRSCFRSQIKPQLCEILSTLLISSNNPFTFSLIAVFVDCSNIISKLLFHYKISFLRLRYENRIFRSLGGFCVRVSEIPWNNQCIIINYHTSSSLISTTIQNTSYHTTRGLSLSLTQSLRIRDQNSSASTLASNHSFD